MIMKKIIFVAFFFTGVNYLLASPPPAMLATLSILSSLGGIQYFLSLFVATSSFFWQFVFAFFLVRLLYQLHISKTVTKKSVAKWSLTVFTVLYFISSGLQIEYLIRIMSYRPLIENFI